MAQPKSLEPHTTCSHCLRNSCFKDSWRNVEIFILHTQEDTEEESQTQGEHLLLRCPGILGNANIKRRLGIHVQESQGKQN